MANISQQTNLQLASFLGLPATNEIVAALNNAVPSGPVTFGDITGTSLNVGSGAVSAGAIAGTTLTGSGALRIGGNADLNGAAGGAGSNTRLTKTLGPLADNTNGTLATITVPNLIAGALIKVNVLGMLGDGDSTNVKTYLIAVNRIAGANATITIGTAFGTATNNGATGNATVTVTLGSVGGAVTDPNTFTILAKVARSAGTSANHVVVGEIQVLNASAGGVTVA